MTIIRPIEESHCYTIAYFNKQGLVRTRTIITNVADTGDKDSVVSELAYLSRLPVIDYTGI